MNPLAALHDSLLVLPNAWDALSARLVESAGARAVATTSAAVAWKYGFPDGERLPLDLQLATISEIARAVRAPITCDLERGYSDSPDEVTRVVERAVEAGAAGVNLEDGGDRALLIAKIRAVKSRLGDRVFVNARTDATTAYLDHARAYEDAGADGFFAIRLSDEATIREVAAGVALPLNVLAQPAISTTKLAAAGARRISAGPGIARAAYSAGRAAAQAMLAGEPYAASLTYPETNALLSP